MTAGHGDTNFAWCLRDYPPMDLSLLAGGEILHIFTGCFTVGQADSWRQLQVYPDIPGGGTAGVKDPAFQAQRLALPARNGERFELCLEGRGADDLDVSFKLVGFEIVPGYFQANLRLAKGFAVGLNRPEHLAGFLWFHLRTYDGPCLVQQDKPAGNCSSTRTLWANRGVLFSM